MVDAKNIYKTNQMDILYEKRKIMHLAGGQEKEYNNHIHAWKTNNNL